MGKVYLEDLKYKNGKVDWKGNIGNIIRIEDNSIIKECKILKVEKGYLYLEINGEEVEKPIFCGNFLKGNIGVLIGTYKYEYKYNIGDVIKDEKRDLVILGQIRYGNRNEKGYKYHCNKDGYEGEITEDHLKNGIGCSVCSNRKAILGINTIWDTDKWAVDMGLISEEDAKKYTRGSGKRIDVICPNCGELKKDMIINHIITLKSIGCKKCGDGISYPEKVMGLVLEQIGIYYESQKIFDWSKNKRYDFYIPCLKSVIEIQGLQHYEETNRGRSLKEEQENDKLKKELALENGLEYIEVDCKESNINFIKNNIESVLYNKINLSNVDWEKVDKESQKSLVFEVCEYWKNKKDEETTKDLEKYFGLCRSTIIKYLNKGTKYGWCFYDGKEEILKNKTNLSKKVGVYKDNQFKGKYPSAMELSRISEEVFGVKFSLQNISLVCLGKKKKYKGYIFKYLE